MFDKGQLDLLNTPVNEVHHHHVQLGLFSNPCASRQHAVTTIAVYHLLIRKVQQSTSTYNKEDPIEDRFPWSSKLLIL